MASDLPPSLRLYRGLSQVAAPFASPYINNRVKRGKEDAARVGERRGQSNVARPAGALVWIHGASVGEILAVAGLVERLRAMNIGILLTSGTVTSATMVAQRFPPEVIHQFIPLDSPRFVARFLDHWQPSFALFVESDLWPNLILAGAERRIPMIVVNGRMSQRSFQKWRMLPGMMRTLMSRFEMCLAQSQGDADRFAALGSPHVFNTGKLQVDVPAPPADPEKLEQLKAAVQGRPVVVAASTHPGEEEHVFEAQRQLERYFPSLITVLAPRHPDRGEGLGQLAANFGLRAALRSRSELPQTSTEVYIADTLGELGLLYRLTPIVFMGGSFANMGGHNPVEAVKLGAATIHGPNVANWSEIYEALGAAGGARRAESGEALVKHIGGWLDDRTAQQRASAAARAVVDRLGGALDKTMAALEPYLLQLRLESGTVHA